MVTPFRKSAEQTSYISLSWHDPYGITMAITLSKIYIDRIRLLHYGSTYAELIFFMLVVINLLLRNTLKFQRLDSYLRYTRNGDIVVR